MQFEKAEKKRKERHRSISRRIVHKASTNQLEKIGNAKKKPLFLDICRLGTSFLNYLKNKKKEQQRTNKFSLLLDKSHK